MGIGAAAVLMKAQNKIFLRVLMSDTCFECEGIMTSLVTLIKVFFTKKTKTKNMLFGSFCRLSFKAKGISSGSV